LGALIEKKPTAKTIKGMGIAMSAPYRGLQRKPPEGYWRKA